MAEDTWYQMALTPPEVVEINLRIGIIPAQDHLQLLVEMKDPTTGILIAQHSVHHAKVRDLPRHLERYRALTKEWVEGLVEPF